ncbi:MAG: RNA polymerase factor sigma-54 [Magnetococcales bacterium]|nr:RNA polymerase factor sigma-54 [Magnetococcales bacterium]
MGMELKLRMGMQLVMTPQLQMAIRLLQMSNLDLQEYLQEELEKNPLLEQVEETQAAASENKGEEAPATAPEKSESEDAAAKSDENFEEPDPTPTTADENKLTEDMPVDADWSDVYNESFGPSTSGSLDPSDAPSLENTLVRGESLQDHLIDQLGPSAMDERERTLGMTIIDAIDDNGYMTQDLEGLAQVTGATLDEIEDALVLIQSFEPAGVAARSLAECLLLQLKSLKMAKSPYTDLLDHLDELARRDFRKLSRVLKLTEEELTEAVSFILSLNPKPGLLFGSDQAGYVVPDVHVVKRKGEWVVEINPDTVPRLRVNTFYQNMVSKQASTEQERKFLSENARSAQWLIKSLEQRSSTIFRVAESIVRFQQEFFELGPEYLKPLILKDVADDIGVHESTTSRVTSNKYMHTPRGIFELKYFFSSSLSSNTGEAHSSEAVKFKIRKLIDSETPRRPYSDEKIAKMLKEEGIKVARRTVAKYRESMGIPSSSRRKRLSPVGK